MCACCVHNHNKIHPAKYIQMMVDHQRGAMIGRVIDIVGISISDHGCCCKEHSIAYCGVVLKPEVNVQLVKENT